MDDKMDKMNKFIHLVDKVYKKTGNVINISTITITSNLNKKIQLNWLYLGLNKFIDEHKLQEVLRIEYGKHGWYQKDIKKNKFFYNQLTIRCIDISVKSIKVFKNGKIQITGLTSIYESDEIRNMIELMLMNIYDDTVQFEIPNQLHLMNVHVKLTCGKLDLQYIHNYMIKECNKTKNEWCIRYDKQIHPALNIKKRTYNNKYITYLIFTSGNVIISGCKSLDDIESIYDKLIDIVSVPTSDIFHKKSINYKKSQMNQKHLFHGYYLKDLLTCL